MITTFHTAARLATQLLFLGNICAITNAVNHSTRLQGGGAGRGTPAASTEDADAGGDASNQSSSPGPLAKSIQQTRNIGKKINVMMASQVLATRSLVELTSTNKAANPNKIHQHHLTRGGAYDDRKLLSKSFEKIGSGPDGGQLVSFHAAHEINVQDDSNKRVSIHSSRKLKKAGSKVSKQTKNSKTPPENKSKAPKSPKKTKAPTEEVSKSQKCTNLVAKHGNWQSWSEDISNFTPIFRPVTDAELRTIVKNSKKHGCTVRMMGARHSQDGMVIQRTEEDAVVISLASHTTEIDGWHDSINPVSSTFRIGAGKSWFDVSALIRPNGFVLHSRTAGANFSVGGVIANMVHGGGRTAEFMHDYVVKMLVLTSDGVFGEVEGEEELKYWRSSAGQLGMIVAIEMKMHSEASPFIAGIDPATGSPVIDFTKGGLVMERESTEFKIPANESEFASFLGELSSKAYATNAMYDSSQFFFNFYTNSLFEYRSNFSGPRFSGAGGDFGDIEKAAKYDAATKALTEANADVAFTGGSVFTALTVDTLCAILCMPPSGPFGDGSPCIQIPSQMVPGANLCEVEIETNAALSIAAFESLDAGWDARSSGANDGYFPNTAQHFDNVVAFVPARTFAIAFSTWYSVTGQVISGQIPNMTFAPNGNLEFRFIDPVKSTLLNPIPTIEELKSDYDDKYGIYFGEDASAFDTLMPPLPPGVPDGWMAIEVVNLRGAYTEDVSKYLFTMQQAWNAMPTNPSVPYGEDVVDICDAANGIFPCAGIPTEGAKCCNPPIPTILAHFGKGWGWGYDPSTTPTTGKMHPFKDADAIANMFKESSISAFNAKRSELDAGIFAGGAMMRWLDESSPNSEFEARKLDGQMCGSPDFVLNPNKECINEMCVNSICVHSGV